jgi:hypothetical protein
VNLQRAGRGLPQNVSSYHSLSSLTCITSEALHLLKIELYRSVMSRSEFPLLNAFHDKSKATSKMPLGLGLTRESDTLAMFWANHSLICVSS